MWNTTLTEEDETRCHLLSQLPLFLQCCFDIFPPAFSLPLQRAFLTHEEFEESHRRPTRAQVNILPLFWTFGFTLQSFRQVWRIQCDSLHTNLQTTILLQTTNHTYKNLKMHQQCNTSSKRQKHQAVQTFYFSCRETLRTVCL